jgi:Arc/MetJ family transcription regulator
MRTNVVLDDETIKEALKVTGIKTKREVIHQALLILIKTKKRKKLSDLKGKITFSEGYDHKKLRERS